MLLYRSVSVLHFHTQKLTFPLNSFSQFRNSYSLLSSSPSARVRICLLLPKQSYAKQSRAFATASSPVAERNGSDTFFSADDVSWASLGVSEKVSSALTKAGFDRPSLVQAASVPSIVSGKDVIIAAETGSR